MKSSGDDGTAKNKTKDNCIMFTMWNNQNVILGNALLGKLETMDNGVNNQFFTNYASKK